LTTTFIVLSFSRTAQFSQTARQQQHSTATRRAQPAEEATKRQVARLAT
jgi:hypothetical protein